MSTLRIKAGRVIDPSRGVDETTDVWIEDGRIAEDSGRDADETIDAQGLIVSPGLIDARVWLGEPGQEEDETIASGAAAALTGGFTSVGAMPDLQPPVDNRAAAEFIVLQAKRAGHCQVFPIGTVTKRREGEELAEIGQLIDGGAVAFTDGKQAIANAEIMRRALQYAGMWNRAVLHHPQVPELVTGGVMHEGRHSTVLGLRGMPVAAEEIMVRRDIALAELTGGRVHLMAISSKNSVDEIRQAQCRGVRVSADVTPHHLLLTDESLRGYDSRYKVDPPLRTSVHQTALIEGLKDGTIGVICSDHQPHAEEKTVREIDQAPFGISGIETLLPICVEALIAPGHLNWSELLQKLTVGPAELLGLKKGTLASGADADVTLIDPAAEWVIDSTQFVSRSSNTPFHGRRVRARSVAVIVRGEVKFRAGRAE
ncbi:MAG: dihydroorotase [Planctomycetota bacterium]|nr:MAG: dihydroorotase [Planctomycetota bacterium]